jgi:hypothetical protein
MKARALGLGLVCSALGNSMFGCADTEREPQPEYPGVSSGSGGTAATSAGNGGSAGAPTSCTVDPDAVPVPVPAPVTGDITMPLPSDGCGKTFAFDRQTRSLCTHGKKASSCADKLVDGTPQCGAWLAEREFRAYLPPAYDPAKPYSLLIEGPGCGGRADDIYPINATSQNPVIRVGIGPGPNSTGHATNPEQGCFDDREGDDSIDWVFYEQLYDVLNAELCFDRHRVFVGGRGSGGTLANELSAKYAGDGLRPVRGAMVYAGYWPKEPAYLPTLSQAPVTGIWLHATSDGTTPFDSTERVVSRAMQLAQCPGGDYEHAQLEDFPIGASLPGSTCQRIIGCDPLYPLVVCPLPTAGQSIHETEVIPAFTQFLQLFGEGSLITKP